MLQVANQTPFATALCVQPDADGIDALLLVVRATFRIGARDVSVAPEQPPVVPGDAYRADPALTSLRHAGELHPPKPATDVVLVGDGHAPDGRPVPCFGVSLSVGPLKKIVHVFGDRIWKPGALTVAATSPVPVARVPLAWERAFGGRHDLGGGRFLAEPRNPVGTGFRGKRSALEMSGVRLPNLEDPAAPIRSVGDRPAPAGFGYVAPSWHPRAGYAGTYDEAWRKRRAPYLPADFDRRFWQAAPPDQILPGHLRGGEPVELVNASPAGVQRFAIPTCRLDAAALLHRRIEPIPLVLDALLLEPDQDRFSLLWHGAVRCDKQAAKIEGASLVLEAMEGVRS